MHHQHCAHIFVVCRTCLVHQLCVVLLFIAVVEVTTAFNTQPRTTDGADTSCIQRMHGHNADDESIIHIYSLYVDCCRCKSCAQFCVFIAVVTSTTEINNNYAHKF